MGNCKLEAFNFLKEVICLIDYETYEIKWINQYGIDKFGTLTEGITCYKYFYGKNKPCSDCNVCELECCNHGKKCYEQTVDELKEFKYRNKKSIVEYDGKKYILSTLYDVEDILAECHSIGEAKTVYEKLISQVTKVDLKGEIDEQIDSLLKAIKNIFQAKRVSFLKLIDGNLAHSNTIKDPDTGEFYYNPIMKTVINNNPHFRDSMLNNRYVEINLDVLADKYPEECKALKDEGEYNFSLMTWTINDLRYHLVIEDYEVTIQHKYAYQIIYDFLFFTIRSLLYNKELYRLGNIDLLTGLDNRNKFNEDVRGLSDELQANIGIMFLDLDRLKEINDNFSHKTGDRLLKAMAKILTEEFKGHSIYRMGGDEFLVMARDVDYYEFYGKIVNMKKRMDAGKIFASYGMCYEEHNGVIQQMLENAEHEMYVYKRIHHQYSLAEEQNAFIQMFKHNISCGRYFIVVQPKFNPYTNEIAGGEVLIRGTEKDGDIEFPNAFIPLFEKNHCIDILDYYVMEETCKLQRRILDEYGYTLPISFNISRTTLLLERFQQDLVNTVAKYNLENWMIRLEITERMDVSAEDVILFAARVKRSGFNIEVDDFGSHFTNLNFFKRDVFSTIKIDRHIINKLSDTSITAKVIGAIIEESHKHGVDIVAEGVETKEELDIAKKMKFDLVQGYYYDKPMFINDFLTKYFK